MIKYSKTITFAPCFQLRIIGRNPRASSGARATPGGDCGRRDLPPTRSKSTSPCGDCGAGASCEQSRTSRAAVCFEESRENRLERRVLKPDFRIEYNFFRQNSFEFLAIIPENYFSKIQTKHCKHLLPRVKCDEVSLKFARNGAEVLK